jgi:hypothetical protein
MDGLVAGRGDEAGTSATRCQREDALQRALLDQWQAAGYVLALVGLTLGAYLVGVGAGAWMLVMCAVLVAPLAGAALAAQRQRYRLAAVSSLLGAGGYAFSALFCLLMAPAQIGDWPSTSEMLTSIMECLLVVPPLLAASRAALGVGRVLWHLPAGPGQIGPGGDHRTMPVIGAGAAAPDRSAQQPPGRLRPTRYAPR